MAAAPHEMECGVCLDYMEDNRECPLCHYLGCLKCISEAYAKTGPACPHCRQAVALTQWVHNVPLQRMIDRVEEPCKIGCGTSVARSDRQRHANDLCPEAEVRCPHRGCDVRLKRRFCASHAEMCSLAVEGCACGQQVLRREMQAHRAISCAAIEQLCPNLCGVSVRRGAVREHCDDVCPLQVVACQNAAVGCAHRCRRAELDGHAGACVFTQLRDVLLQVKGRLDKLEDENRRLRQENAGLSTRLGAVEALLSGGRGNPRSSL